MAETSTETSSVRRTALAWRRSSGDDDGDVAVAAKRFALTVDGSSYSAAAPGSHLPSGDVEADGYIGAGSSIGAPVVGATSYVGVGGFPRADAGLVRMPWMLGSSAEILSMRNATDNGNWRVIGSNGGNLLAFSHTTAITRVYGASAAFVSSAGCEMGVNGTTFYGHNAVIFTPFNATPSAGGGNRVMFLHNAIAVPSTNPTGGVQVYVESGALKARSPAGTIETLVTNDPHCPNCGTDAGVTETRNDVFGEELITCKMCETRTGNGVIRCVTDFWDWKVAA